MKMFVILSLVALCAAPLVAEDASVTQSRSLQQFGTLLSWGQDSGLSLEHWGVSIRSFTYLDGSKPDGAYFAILSGTLVHNLDSGSISDMRLLGLGWRGNPFAALGQASPARFSLDFSAAPVVELRLKPNEWALDSASLALGGTLGVYFPIGEGSDLGISWEPVVDLGLFAWGNRRVRDANYADFVVSWVVKTATETRKLPWESES